MHVKTFSPMKNVLDIL